MPWEAGITLLSQHQYLPLRKLDIQPNASAFCAQIHLENSWEHTAEDNPIAKSVTRKKQQIDNLVKLLESKNFSQDFIKVTKDFCDNNILKAEQEMARQYSLLIEGQSKKISLKEQEYQTTSVTSVIREIAKQITELQNDFVKEKTDFLTKYNKLQTDTRCFFNNIDDKISSQDREIEQRTTDILCQKAEIVPVIPELVEPVTIEIKPFIAAKRLDICSSFSPGEYLVEWTKKVSEVDYKFVIISVGSRGKINQQIPPFSNGLGSVAILNIDPCFLVEDLENISNSNTISVNYVKAQIKVDSRFSFGPASKRQEHEANNHDIKQEELATSIDTLMTSGKKVILLSHISLFAPRMQFEQVLKNQDIMNNYGNKFLFINSYFENSPTILCNKSFIKSMLEPNMKPKSIQNKYIYTGEKMPKGEEALKDLIVSDKMQEFYDRMELEFRSPNRKSICTNEYTVYKNLSLVEPDKLISLLGDDSIDQGDMYSFNS
jgi:hypothetical protein